MVCVWFIVITYYTWQFFAYTLWVSFRALYSNNEIFIHCCLKYCWNGQLRIYEPPHFLCSFNSWYIMKQWRGIIVCCSISPVSPLRRLSYLWFEGMIDELGFLVVAVMDEESVTTERLCMFTVYANCWINIDLQRFPKSIEILHKENLLDGSWTRWLIPLCVYPSCTYEATACRLLT